MIKREFSWSYNRYKLFTECPKKYYYHYYGAWGGWEINGTEKSKFLYRLKNLQSPEMWLQSIFSNSIKKIILEHNLSLDYLKRATIFQIRSQTSSMLQENFKDNPKSKLIKNLILDREHIHTFKNYSEFKMFQLIDAFSEHSLWQCLTQIPYISFKTTNDITFFIYNNIKIWTKPSFIWEDHGKLKLANLFFYDPTKSDNWAFKASLDKMLVKNLFPGYNDYENISFSLFKTDFPPLYSSINKKALKLIMQNSCEAMLNLTNLDTDICDECFYKVVSEQCQNCNFNTACNP